MATLAPAPSTGCPSIILFAFFFSSADPIELTDGAELPPFHNGHFFSRKHRIPTYTSKQTCDKLLFFSTHTFFFLFGDHRVAFFFSSLFQRSILDFVLGVTMSSGNGERTIKVLLIGDSGVGKSSLLLSFTTGAFDENISATIGIDFKVKKVEVVDPHSGTKATVNLQLWDTAGQERFRTLTSSYYRGAQAVVLVYDVNEPQTFHGLKKWLDEANSYCRRDEVESKNVVFLLIGNKTDLCLDEDSMPLLKSTAQSFAQQNNMLFALASAKTKIGVAQAFDEVARSAYEKLQDAERYEKRRITNLNNSSDNGGGSCC